MLRISQLNILVEGQFSTFFPLFRIDTSTLNYACVRCHIEEQNKRVVKSRMPKSLQLQLIDRHPATMKRIMQNHSKYNQVLSGRRRL